MMPGGSKNLGSQKFRLTFYLQLSKQRSIEESLSRVVCLFSIFIGICPDFTYPLPARRSELKGNIWGEERARVSEEWREGVKILKEGRLMSGKVRLLLGRSGEVLGKSSGLLRNLWNALKTTVREGPGKSPQNLWRSLGTFWEVQGLGKPDPPPSDRQHCHQISGKKKEPKPKLFGPDIFR